MSHVTCVLSFVPRSGPIRPGVCSAKPSPADRGCGHFYAGLKDMQCNNQTLSVVCPMFQLHNKPLKVLLPLGFQQAKTIDRRYRQAHLQHRVA